MGRKSTIHKLPDDIRQYIERCIHENRMTLDEIIEDLKNKFPESSSLPARSTLGRYKISTEKLIKRMREQEQIAQIITKELGDNPGESAGQLLVQTVTSLTAHSAMMIQEQEKIDLATIRQLTRSARDVMVARRISFDEKTRIEKRARERLLEEQRKNLEKIARSQGMSNEDVRFFNENVLITH
ncbi:DUF3486 family protein [Salmonella enterica subsp. enterica serovar Kandla]|nr:DUF3486 family protein [Salmonella enterica subsp. enterica serovar Kandla]EBX9803907.1 DUF3486 family protein [Salmonella enterica subsp. enterica serovar Kandla]EBY1904291.1 DUF3486 family protein [Salmonella enterica subsp. enterica serovar Kandla]ECD3785996.1 DUF3486 family protein [Salmonella enterica subsp. enterica serovar Kandla]